MSDEKKDNVTNLFDVIQGGGNPDKMKAAIETVEKNMPAMLGLMLMNAKVIKAKYNALIAEGFTDQQALFLLVNTPLFVTR